tara:strand:- start:80775 stop:81809 length:1035 start_codon:yes stop_codon:yes gene_type:complete
MACIIKLPNKSKGIISFTTPENRELVSKSEVRSYLDSNRDKWVYLLHHNWQPGYSDGYYDSNLCNSIDLVNGGNCLEMDCCNFSPEVYTPAEKKAFDVLYVARCVTFKRINTFFNVCKQLLSRKPNIKILFICSVPNDDCDPSNPKQIYLDMFTREERKNFLTLFIDYDYPFPISKEFLAHFYNSSKVFLHTASSERHPRVCSYAWASGIPVVGYLNLATFLPTKFIAEPFFYQVNHDDEYVEQILKAISVEMPYDEIKYFVSENFATETFTNKLSNLFSENNFDFNNQDMYLKNLDFRMGRHCIISLGDNSIPISIPDLMEKSVQLRLPTDTPDLELSLSKER